MSSYNITGQVSGGNVVIGGLQVIGGRVNSVLPEEGRYEFDIVYSEEKYTHSTRAKDFAAAYAYAQDILKELYEGGYITRVERKDKS